MFFDLPEGMRAVFWKNAADLLERRDVRRVAPTLVTSVASGAVSTTAAST